MTFGMNSSTNMGMGSMNNGSSDIFKGMSVKNPPATNQTKNFGDFDLL